LSATVLALAAAILAACGDGGEPAPTAAARPTISDPQFAAKVETICANGRTRGIRYQPPGPGESERDALTNAIQSNLLPALQAVIDEIDALPSQEQVSQLEPMLVSMQEAVDAAEALDLPTMQAVERLFATSGQLARKAGLEACIYDDGSAGLG
jgi:hypothetical protein